MFEHSLVVLTSGTTGVPGRSPPERAMRTDVAIDRSLLALIAYDRRGLRCSQEFAVPERTDRELEQTLVQCLKSLLASTRQWNEKEQIDLSAVARIRHRALLINARRYCTLIPAYRKMAEESGIISVKDVHTISNELTVTTDIFKSYDRSRLDRRDFGAMNGWLGTIFFRRIPMATEESRSIQDWCRRLSKDRIYVSYSSGTSGSPSFIPRDPLSLWALRASGSYYPHPVLCALTSTPFDCLLMTPRGLGTGLQNAASAIADLAETAHFLYDVPLTADMVGAGPSKTAMRRDRNILFEQSLEFLKKSIKTNRSVLIFGPPFEVLDMCRYAAENFGELHLPPGSVVMTGGGWKNADHVPENMVEDLIAAALGVPSSHTVDGYSTSELNVTLQTCTERRYHIPPLVEPLVVDDQLTPLEGSDNTGTLAFLDPFAVSYPGFLVTGDVGRLINDRCDCGLDGWSIAGRITRSAHTAERGCAGVAASVLA
ncbi:hypothetical protein ACIBCN_02220 [Nocardia sp. NPDC051052]|uniref:LuxE/PaaK family acyltransferase n=1 Tax=Nocardia sp. NPDC051052 TaxID=3364322 RepID=UPI0037A34B29